MYVIRSFSGVDAGTYVCSVFSMNSYGTGQKVISAVETGVSGVKIFY